MYLPKVYYSAIVASLTSEQCWEVEHKSVRDFLSALGYNSNMPCSFSFESFKIGVGVNTEHGVQHILALIRHLKDGATVGSLLTILLWKSQLISKHEAVVSHHLTLDLE